MDCQLQTELRRTIRRQWINILVLAIASSVYYWRTGTHLRRLAHQSMAADTQLAESVLRFATHLERTNANVRGIVQCLEAIAGLPEGPAVKQVGEDLGGAE